MNEHMTVGLYPGYHRSDSDGRGKAKEKLLIQIVWKMVVSCTPAISKLLATGEKQAGYRKPHYPTGALVTINNINSSRGHT